MTESDAEIAAQLRKLLNAYPLGTMDWPLDVMKDAADALDRRASSPAPEGDGWRTMESAPKDGSQIMLFARGTSYIGSWDDDRYAKKPRPLWYYSDIWRRTGCHEVPPTHWMPLPLAPGAEGLDAAEEQVRGTKRASSPAHPAPEEVERLREENARLKEALNTPELRDFSAGVVAEAQHQRERWGVDGDAGKTPADWFWLVGYLAGKALTAASANNTDKALHHCISTAAALSNWHAMLNGTHSRMRPGIDGIAALSSLPSEGRSGKS